MQSFQTAERCASGSGRWSEWALFACRSEPRDAVERCQSVQRQAEFAYNVQVGGMEVEFS